MLERQGNLIESKIRNAAKLRKIDPKASRNPESPFYLPLLLCAKLLYSSFLPAAFLFLVDRRKSCLLGGFVVPCVLAENFQPSHQALKLVLVLTRFLVSVILLF